MSTWFIALSALGMVIAALLILGLRSKKRGQGKLDYSSAQPGHAATTADALSREMERVAKSAGGSVGVFAVHLESGRHAGFNAEERFPMASLFKVPLAVALLSRADSGGLDLDSMIEVKAADLRTGSGLLQMTFKQPRVTLSVLSLIDLMIVASDNSASDILLRLSGGPGAVNTRMRQIGIRNVHLDRSTAQLIADFDASQERFLDDSRDTATPEAMTRLLAQIWRSQALRPATAELLLDAMRRCQTGSDRIRGLLPGITEVAHKTGTLGAVANDTGIITLPDRTHLAITVLSTHREATDAQRSRTIAEMARIAFDYFLFVK